MQRSKLKPVLAVALCLALPFASVTAGDAALPVLGDIGWQATTLGGRQVDTVLKGKASFREGSETVGEIGMIGFQAALGSGDSGAAGALAVVGIAAMMLSAATKAKADIRHWENLPDRIHGDFLAADVTELSIAEITADGDAYLLVLEGRSWWLAGTYN